MAQEVLLDVNRKIRDRLSRHTEGDPTALGDPASRKEHVPMASLFRSPSLRGFAQEIDAGLARAASSNDNIAQFSSDTYSKDAEKLSERLQPSYPPASPLSKTSSLTVFLTGATGFLGAYVVREILQRGPHIRLIAHVRAKGGADAGMQRLKDTSQAYGFFWNPDWESRLKCVAGELGSSRLGLSQEDYREVKTKADVIIHNGAAVHWVQPYEQLRRVNVLSTIEALQLCSTSASETPKRFAFVSSTSVLDAEEYAIKSEKSTQSGGTGIKESDTLEDSRHGLGTGYGQSKWVGEYLMREAGSRGLVGATIRPGYILGDSKSGGEFLDL